MSNRVVITGIGAVTPIGIGAQAFWDNAKLGKCGIKPITQYDASEDKVRIAGEIPEFDPLVCIDKKEARRMARFCQMGMVAASEAVDDSGLIGKVEPERLGVLAGAGIGGITEYEKATLKVAEGKRNLVSAFLVPSMIPNILPGQIAIKYGAKGVCSCTVTACSSGTNCIGDAFRLIKDGYLTAVITGGAESVVSPVTISGFANMTALSTKNDPNASSTPFDKDRDGFVMGEGAGMLVLEEYEHAKSRGAKIYAEIVGYGQTCDAYHITAPSPNGEGAKCAMLDACREGEIDIREVGYINAHGTGTPANDKCETIAIKSAYGVQNGSDIKGLVVNSTKSLVGHLLGGSGAVEAIITALTLRDEVAHPTIGLKTPDPDCDLDYVSDARSRDISGVRYALTNSFGFGGHNAVLLMKKV
ncbi:MAG: beta-ketoacyl-ACP synthase II [Clostridiales bacterium]|jgi:3-oxoacyl-[acyl-carrier-protein] synthase II|nr:beta-ketoacyl-ACP synthase II [Clostridiales bacterium]